MKTTQCELTFDSYRKVYKKVKEYCSDPELDPYKVRRLADASHLTYSSMLLDFLKSEDRFEQYSGDQLRRIECGLDWLIKAEKEERK